MTKKNKAAQELGRLGGLAKSDAKAEAAKANGKKGGRPKKHLEAASGHEENPKQPKKDQ